MPNLLAHPVDAKLSTLFGSFLGNLEALRLNLDTAVGKPIAGFVNLGRTPGAGVDIAFDIEGCEKYSNDGPLSRLPFSDDSVDVVLAVRVLERVVHLVPLLNEVARILKPGGHLLVIAPYAGSDNAWENPENVRAFTELTWTHLARLDIPLMPAKVKLLPFPDVTAPTEGGVPLLGQQQEFEHRKRFMRNVVAEMHVALEKVEV